MGPFLHFLPNLQFLEKWTLNSHQQNVCTEVITTLSANPTCSGMGINICSTQTLQLLCRNYLALGNDFAHSKKSKTGLSLLCQVVLILLTQLYPLGFHFTWTSCLLSSATCEIQIIEILKYLKLLPLHFPLWEKISQKHPK